jgi:hypothetical protein
MAAVLAEAKILATAYLFDDRRFFGDVRSVARSVARFTWNARQPDKKAKYIVKTHESENQRAKVQKRWAAESQKAAGLELLKAGKCVPEIVRELSVSESSVRRWKRELTAPATSTL